MLKQIFSTESIYPDQALAVVRIITGMFMIYHGMEVFDKNTMMGYTDWDVFKKFPSATVVVYIGKSAEFIAGSHDDLYYFFRRRRKILVWGPASVFICFIGYNIFFRRSGCLDFI